MKNIEFDNRASYLERATMPLTWDQAERIMEDAINPIVKYILILGFNTGLRASDLRALKWVNVFDFEKFQSRYKVTVLERKTRRYNRKRVLVFNEYVQIYTKKIVLLLEPAPWEYIASYNTNPKKQVSQKNFNKRIVNELVKHSLIKRHPGNISSHIMRKTFAQRVHDIFEAENPGSGMLMASKFLNHRSVLQTMTYLGVTRAKMEEVFDLMYAPIEKGNSYEKVRKIGPRRRTFKYSEWPVKYSSSEEE